MKMFLFAAGFAAMAIPAAAQSRAEFQVGGVSIDVALPSGYCTPTGDGLEIARLIASADADNVTDLTLFPCADQSGQAPDYYLVKTPKVSVQTGISRANLLVSLRAEFDKPEYASAMQAAQVNAKASDTFTRMIQQKTEISGGVVPLGLDETCAYLGGVVHFKAGETSYSRAIGGCITAVGDRVVMVYRYTEGDPGNVLPMTKSAKALALAMKAKPAK